MKERIVRTVCRMCQAGCGIQVHVEDGKIVKVSGLAEDPRTRGALCPKGFAATQLVHSPDRLQYPLKRVGERGAGKWQRITWDEALHFIASRLKEIKGSHGAEAISVFKGAL